MRAVKLVRVWIQFEVSRDCQKQERLAAAAGSRTTRSAGGLRHVVSLTRSCRKAPPPISLSFAPGCYTEARADPSGQSVGGAEWSCVGTGRIREPRAGIIRLQVLGHCWPGGGGSCVGARGSDAVANPAARWVRPVSSGLTFRECTSNAPRAPPLLEIAPLGRL